MIMDGPVQHKLFAHTHDNRQHHASQPQTLKNKFFLQNCSLWTEAQSSRVLILILGTKISLLRASPDKCLWKTLTTMSCATGQEKTQLS